MVCVDCRKPISKYERRFKAGDGWVHADCSDGRVAAEWLETARQQEGRVSW